MTRVFGLLLIAFAVVGIPVTLCNAQPGEPLFAELRPWLIWTILPGAALWILSAQMGEVRLWSYWCAITVSFLIPAQMLFAPVMRVNGVDFAIYAINLTVMRIPMLFLLAALLNAMPHVIDGYRGYKRDREMMQRGFAPLIISNPVGSKAHTLPPPPKAMPMSAMRIPPRPPRRIIPPRST